MPAYSAKQLIQHIAKAPADDAQNLLALFDALDTVVKDPQYSIEPASAFSDEFTDFYLKQAQKTTAENPDSLGAHLLLIAQKALIDQLSGREENSLHHAKTVAQALVQSQCKPAPAKSISFMQQHWFAMAASSFVFAIIAWYGWASYQVQQQPTIANTIAPKAANKASIATNQVTADQASEMYQKFEMMRSGTCRYLEAIQIPDEHKAVYIENVMGGKLPNNLEDLAIANAYLEKIQCSYTPMLMKKST